MKHNEFKIGNKFVCGGKNWLVTDIGSRVIIAICLNDYTGIDDSWYYGPPYAVAEHVFDEYDIEGCNEYK
jgi:hypothetical protein